MKSKSWILPDGINEILAPDGYRLEALRRKLLDMFQNWGYDYVIPPVVEHLDSLLTGTGSELDLQTFKLTDLVSGRLIGLRADITPQIARIDASQNHDTPSRYCYVGTVLHTRAFDFNGVRDPLQIGVELFGHKGLESDLEVISLMLETLKLAGVEDITLDLGHVGIVQQILQSMQLTPTGKQELVRAIGRKSQEEIITLCSASELQPQCRLLLALVEMNGNREVILQGREQFRKAADIDQKIDRLLQLSEFIEKDYPQVNIVFDLAELKGYQYHTGVVFSAFVAGKGKEIARGGRYDEIGKAFGRFRPATGFSTDLKALMNYCPQAAQGKPCVWAPASKDPALQQMIFELREKNMIVIRSFSGKFEARKNTTFTHTLEFINQQWQLVEIHG